MRTRLIRVIETWERRGLGKENDPVRLVRQFWSPKGELLMEEPDEYELKPNTEAPASQPKEDPE